MTLFEIRKNRLLRLKEEVFKLEKDIQKLIESNLNLIIGLEFVKSEFIIKGKRIDTLAFDRQSNGFVIRL